MAGFCAPTDDDLYKLGIDNALFYQRRDTAADYSTRYSTFKGFKIGLSVCVAIDYHVVQSRYLRVGGCLQGRSNTARLVAHMSRTGYRGWDGGVLRYAYAGVTAYILTF